MTRLPIEHEPHHGRSGHHKRFADILKHLRNREHFTQCGLTQSYLTAIHTLVYNKSDVVITNQKEGGNNVAL